MLIRQRQWRVERAHRDRHILRLDVTHRERRITFLAPFDRPVFVPLRQRPRRVRPQHARGRLAGWLAAHRAPTPFTALVDASLDLLPYQLEPALAMFTGHARRVLVADEVGLGKTIQAAVALAELSRRQRDVRALIIAPAMLCDQWIAELDRRFGLTVEPADRDGLATIRDSTAFGTDVWRNAGIRIASVDYIKQPHVLDAMPLVAWDLVIIDEAHDVCGESQRHQACDELVRRARKAMLLTATPHSGDGGRFVRLERLGQFSSIPDKLMVFRRTRASAGLQGRRRVAWHAVPLEAIETRLLDTLVAFERAVLARPGSRQDAAVLLLAMFRKRALSTFAALDKSLERRQVFLEDPAALPDWYQPRLEFDEDAQASPADQRALMAEIDLPPGQERTWIRRLRALAAAALRVESKIARLVAFARRTTEPIVVFTEFRDSLTALEPRLASVRKVSVLHGAQTLEERRHSLRRFHDGETSVLLTTDVGGQGLNLQHRARWVVSLELPWNPIRLEQRVGRVDRIGQKQTTHLTLLVARHAAETTLLLNLSRRVLAARRALGHDVLGHSLPAEHAVAAELLGVGHDIRTTEPTPPVITSSQWQRRARAEVAVLSRRRRLRSLWRGDATTQGRPWSTVLCVGAGFRGQQAALLAFPLVDGNGDTIEHVAVAGRCASGTPVDVIREGLTELVRRRLEGRLARLRRGAEARVQAAIRVEMAIAAHLRAVGYPEETALGLFDRSEARRFDEKRLAAAEGNAAHLSQLDELARQTTVSVGPSVLLGIISWR